METTVNSKYVVWSQVGTGRITYPDDPCDIQNFEVTEPVPTIVVCDQEDSG